MLTLNGIGKGRLLARQTAIIVITAIAIWITGGKSLAFAWRYEAPDTALRYDPSNAQALGARAEQMLLAGDKQGRKLARTLASTAVQHDASSTAAIATLGLIAAADGKNDLAARQFKYAQTLSRRNLPTQLWFIDKAVAADDVTGALRHYDIALRTSALAPAILFPVLKAALADSEFVAPIAQVLARRPNWGPAYVRELADSGPDLANIAALFEALRRHGTPVGGYEDVMLQQRLGDAGQFESAWTVYRGTHPGADRATLRDGNLTTVAADASIFDWRTDPATATGAISVSNAAAGGARFDATDVSGVVARQILLLSPGIYQLNGMVSDYTATPRGFAELQVICLTAKTVQIRVALPSASGQARRFGGRFAIEAACPVQQLLLYAESRDSETLSATVSGLTLRHVDSSPAR